MRNECLSSFRCLVNLRPRLTRQQERRLPCTRFSHNSTAKRRNVWVRVLIIGTFVAGIIILGIIFSKHEEAKKIDYARILATPMRQDTSLAAVSFLWKNQPTGENRVYFQDEANYIKEAIWSGGSWSSKINIIGKAKPGTPLAATTRRIDYDHIHIWVFYLDEQNRIQWFDGTFVTCNPDVRTAVATKGSFPAHPSTKLAVIRRPCCDLDLWWLFYHDENGNLQMLTSTENEPGQINIQGPTNLDANSSVDTALAAIPITYEDYPEQVRLFYQRPDGTIAANDWKSPDTWAALDSNASRIDNWQQEAEVRPAQLPQTSLASFSSGFDMTAGLPRVVDIFSSNKQGIAIDTWLGANNDGKGGWVESSESSKQASAFATVSKSSAVALNQDQKAYVVEGDDLVEYELADDDLTWTRVGIVPTVGSPTANEL